jgi:hypothetical protein
MSNFDDEDLPLSSAKTSTAVVTPDDLDVDWGDQDAMTTTDGLDRIQPADKTSKVRVAVIDKAICKPKMAWLHFVNKADGKKVGVRCHSKRDKKHVITEIGECCVKLNNDDNQKAQLNFAALGVKYTNADPKTGKYEKDSEGNQAPVKWELGWLKLSQFGFKSVSELALEGEEPHEFDFTLANRAGGAVGYEYKRVSQKARYRTIPELLAEVNEAAKKFSDGVLLTKRLGKVISSVDLKALLAGKTAAKSGGTIDDVSDL